MFDKTVMLMAEGSVSVIQCTTGCRYIHNVEDCNPVLRDDRNGGSKEIVKYSTDSITGRLRFRVQKVRARDCSINLSWGYKLYKKWKPCTFRSLVGKLYLSVIY